MSVKTDLEELIKNKDWEGIIKKPEIYYNAIIDYSDTLEYDRSFFTEFIYVEKYFKVLATRTFGRFDILFTALTNMTHKLRFIAKDWKTWSSTFDKYVQNGIVNRHIGFMKMTGKNQNFMQFLFRDDNFSYYFEKIDAEGWGYLFWKTPRVERSLKILSLEELNKMKEVIIKYDISVTSNIISVVFNSDATAILKLTKNKQTYFDFGEALQNVSYKDFEKIIIKKINKESSLYVINNYFNWFKYNKDVEISEKLLNILLDINPSLNAGIVEVLNKEQLINNIQNLNIYHVAVNKNISLDEIVSLKKIGPDKRINLTEFNRFFTDEEIAANPNFFDPERIKRIGALYVSKETFKLLNKTWGKKQRYDNDLTSFSQILYSAYDKNMIDLDSLKYIIEKTKPSETTIFKTLTVKSSISNFSFSEELDILQTFTNKYK